jgi:hypothetical protein
MNNSFNETVNFNYLKLISMKIFVLIITSLFFTSAFYAQTAGNLSVTITTSEVGGRYKPKNIVAIWIQDNSNNFVKTLLAYAQTRKQYLTDWKTITTNAGSPYNIVDAVSGATRTSHSTRSCAWNGTNINSQLVTDGTYIIKMEITDQNGTGRSGSFIFTKGPNPQILNPADIPSFSNISINWQPTTAALSEELSDLISIYPNPVNSKTIVYGIQVKSVELMTLKGESVFISKSNILNLNGMPAGIYIARIETPKGLVFKKIVKDQ